MIFGVIGGAGVAATNTLCSLIERKITCAGAYRDGHHPEMIIYQATKAPSRSMYLEGRGPSFIEDYISVGQKLKRAGANILCMSCNTAHAAIEQIQEQINLPFINMIEEVVLEAKNRKKRNIGLIASDGCLKGKVYEKYFNAYYPEANIIYPDAHHQQKVTRGICNVKNVNRFLEAGDPNRPRNIFIEVYNSILTQGAETIIVGCTDIRVDFKHSSVVDSLEVLANSIVERYYNDEFSKGRNTE